MHITATELARQLGGELDGDGSIFLTGFGSAEGALPGELTFAESAAHLAAAEAGAASAVLVGPSLKENRSANKVLLRVPDARVAAARALALFYPPETFATGIDASARIDATAEVDPTAHVGPGCVIGARVRIGARSALLGGNNLGADCRLGDDVRLAPNVVLYARTEVGHRTIIHAGTVVGSDGYGYVFDQGRHRKMPQIGHVIIGDDVEIGANTAIDRGALGPTRIGDGTKIDNLVHLAHGVSIGRHCLIMGQVGFAGSTQLGDYGVVASQSGIAGHLKLGRQCIVGAKSGVMRDVGEKETVLGIPAAPDKQAKRQWIAVQKLPDLMQRMRELEKQIAALTAAKTPTASAEAK